MKSSLPEKKWVRPTKNSADAKSRAPEPPSGSPCDQSLDFGLARRIVSKDTRLTHTGMILGSPQFMAPEQALSEREIGVEADIYALGGTLYFALSGRPPFEGGDLMNLLMQVVQKEPPRLSHRNPKVSREIETVVHKCLEKSPQDRYPVVGMVHQDLLALLSGRPILAQPPGPFQKVQRFVKKNRALAVGIFLVPLLILIPLLGLQIQAEREKKAKIQSHLKEAQRLMGDIRGNLSDEKSRNGAIEKCIRASSFLERALELNPDSSLLKKRLFEVQKKLGELALKNQNGLLCRLAWERCRNLNPKKGERLLLFLNGYWKKLILAEEANREGYSLLANKQITPSIYFFSRAIALQPEYSAYYLNRGFAHYQLGEMEKALKDYNRAIELNPQKESSYKSPCCPCQSVFIRGSTLKFVPNLEKSQNFLFLVFPLLFQ